MLHAVTYVPAVTPEPLITIPGIIVPEATAVTVNVVPLMLPVNDAVVIAVAVAVVVICCVELNVTLPLDGTEPM